MKLTLDFETRSCVSLKDCGPWVYGEDHTTDAMCMAAKVDGDAPVIWLNPMLAEKLPEGHGLPLIPETELFRMVKECDVFECHNLEFERALWEVCCTPKYKWPALQLEKARCSLAKASYHGMPRGLGDLCKALGVAVQKDDVGAKVMMKMCRPKRLVKAEWEAFAKTCGYKWTELKAMQVDLYQTIALGWHHVDKWSKRWGIPAEPVEGHLSAGSFIDWYEDPQDIVTLCRYCMTDVEAEHHASEALPDLPERELRVWQMDQQINARGLATDQRTAHLMVEMVSEHTADLLDELSTITNGEVQTPKQTQRFKNHVNALLPEEHQLGDLRAESVKTALKNEAIQGEARRLLEIRKSLALSSVAKYEAIINRASRDGRVRSSILYHGAGTGRFSGRGIQPHNFPRGKFSDTGACIDLINEGGADLARVLWGDPLAIASTCLRGVLVAPEGKEFTCSDYSNIEGRVVAWLAGEEWKVQSFRDYDTIVGFDAKGKPIRKGEDNYKMAYSRAFDVDVKAVTKDMRQIGKVMELACFAGDTLVLTDSGWKQLETVSTDDLLWDGVEFVAHDGVIPKGERAVINLRGLHVTPDHEFFVPYYGDWFTAEELQKDESLLVRALDVAALSRGPELRTPSSRDHSQVYDILNCGPRNRFFVLTDQGPLVAHNCGYQGGVGAFQTMAGTYGVRVPDEQAQELVKLWREAHPNVVALWYGLEEAALMAVGHPGKAYKYRDTAYKMSRDGRFLLCRLPSGRLLHYAFPELREEQMPWGAMKTVVTYMATDSQTGKFVKSKGYGGLFTENCVQALSRDVMVEGMFRVEEAGYPVVLTVHDEVLSEHEVGFGSVDEFSTLLSVNPPWADGLPIAAAGWRGTRYRKD